MRILISNDDGLYTEGLDILIDFAKTISDDVWVVVPNKQRSASGHAITLHDIVRVKKIKEKVFTTSGTPVDSMILAIHHIMKDNKPDLVLSGINNGRNVADDIAYSGTIAVAREARMHGIAAIAFSQGYDRSQGVNFNSVINFDCSKKWLKKVYDLILSHNDNNSFLNINFPALKDGDDVKGIKIVPQGRKKKIDMIKHSLNTRNEDYFWIDFQIDETNKENIISDIDAISNGYISITPISLNFTHHDDLNSIKERFEKEVKNL
jgi:5'-nucleotidase